MISRFLIVAAALLTLPVFAGPIEAAPARESDASRASKSGKLGGEVDGVKFVVTYGRPKVKGRKVGVTW